MHGDHRHRGGRGEWAVRIRLLDFRPFKYHPPLLVPSLLLAVSSGMAIGGRLSQAGVLVHRAVGQVGSQP